MWQLISKFVMLIGMINANQICTWPFYEPEVPSVLKDEKREVDDLIEIKNKLV